MDVGGAVLTNGREAGIVCVFKVSIFGQGNAVVFSSAQKIILH